MHQEPMGEVRITGIIYLPEWAGDPVASPMLRNLPMSRIEAAINRRQFAVTGATRFEGVVLSVHDSEPDHPAFRGLASIRYALTQHRRASAGWAALAGNHIFIDSGGIVVALCHLQQGSVQVARGQRVRVGDVLGRCGNSGNSTEPHLHIQAIDSLDISRANAVRLTFNGSLPTNGDVIHADETHRHSR